ncbi:hypothetical protein [Ruminococcus sp. NK3A76]|uniref:hypothetical protein n=1 Tax=Ruminococcus sp. NK3A76 TaxID=877411 RepID=UPI00068EE706|nr:hypothetical protein [Ruminococcus sp. NK3A76]
MPSAVVHLRVAYDLKKKLKVENNGQFYIGAVSPDAVNIDGFADQSIRYPAHLRSLDYEEWKENVRSFFTKEHAKWAGREDHLKGFLLHILTDIYWDEIAQPEMFKALETLGAKPEELRDLKWKELYRFNNKLAGEWLYDEVFPDIKKGECFAIGTVDTVRLRRYVEHLTTEYMTSVKAVDGEPLVCSMAMVQKVEAACLHELTSISNSLK